jgi:hypothetical protein
MKRAIRVTFRLLACSLLVLAAIGWVRSYFSIDALHWSDGQRFVSVLSSAGRVNAHVTDWMKPSAWGSDITFSSTSRANPANRPMWETDPDIYGRRRFLGFEWSADLPPWPSRQTVFLSFYLPPYTLIAVPYWAVVLLAMLPWLLPALRGCRRRSRERQGRCPTCAYDLRATPAACPECGWRSPAARAAAVASAVARIVPM